MKPARKTYWHLGADRRLPSDYEIATSKLLCHVDRGGFAVELPTSDFYRRHQAGSQLVSDRWDQLCDPRATTYTKQGEALGGELGGDLFGEREGFVGRLLTSIEESDCDRELPAAWAQKLGDVLSPLRFLCHGLQMVAAYVGQMAPSGRIAVAALFQCGDEIRRIHRFAYRTALLARRRPDLGKSGRALWQSDPRWQPLRQAMEKLLVTYDWGEAFVVLNVCFKPMLDDVFLLQLAELADRSGDHLDGQILRSLFEDCQWHRAWTESLLALANADRPGNRLVVRRWIDTWAPTIDAAARAAAALLGTERRSAPAFTGEQNDGGALG